MFGFGNGDNSLTMDKEQPDSLLDTAVQGIVGRGVERVDGPLKVAGRATYAAEYRVEEILFHGGEARPTALLAMSDKIGLAALDWLVAQGIRVPAEVSIVGFDGVPESAQSTPPLTTVEQPFRQIAERSVAAILDDAMPAGREILPQPSTSRATFVATVRPYSFTASTTIG